MKKRNTQIALGLCAVALVAVFAVSCSNSFEPAWKASDGKTTLSIRLGKPVAPSASSRLIVQNGGYLYIQTGHDAGTAILYGPWKVSAGDTFTTNDIPAGTYSAIHLIYSAEPLPDATPIIPYLDETFPVALGSRLSASGMTLDSVSLATIPNVTIIEGTTNVLKATLLPATEISRDVSVSESTGLTNSPDSRAKAFIQLTNTSSGIGENERLASLDVTIANTSLIDSVSLFYLALYRADGSFVSAQAVSSPMITAGGYRDINLPYAGANPDSLFLYVEYQGSDMQITILSCERETLPQYEYYVSTVGEGFGRTAANSCTLEYALNTIADDARITAATPATIYLVEDVSLTADVGFAVSRPTRITSLAGYFHTITNEAYIDGSLFFVDDAFLYPTLTIDHVLITGDGTHTASYGLVRIDRGHCVLGSDGQLSTNVSGYDTYGGAVTLNGATSTFTMNDGSSITNCSAFNGGGVYLSAGTFTLRGTISGCNASNFGGGIYASGGALSIQGGGVMGNSTGSSGYGGGLCLVGGSHEMTNGVIGDMDAANIALWGGGVYVDSASFSFRGGSIQYNGAPYDAAASGGGVFVNGSDNPTSFTMPAGSTGQILNNSLNRPTSSYINGGAGVCAIGINARLELYGGIIGSENAMRGNAASNADGGGVFIQSGRATLGGTRILNNSATSGGGVYIGDDGQLVLGSGVRIPSIQFNTAASAGGVYKALSGTITETAATILQVSQDNGNGNYVEN